VADASGFSIGELSRRTGVPVPTLRTWEERYGQPRSRRLASGHRRYDERSVDAVQLILRQRASGLSMEAAAAAVDDDQPLADSLFAGLRRAHPEIPVHVLTKQTLLALSRAVEDEFAARASHAVLFAAFQRARFFEQSRARWVELARTAEFTAVFADFPDLTANDATADSLHLVSLAPDTPLLREWSLVCDSPGYAMCLVGWEQPTRGKPDRLRQYETLWTVDPRAVRTAARLAAHHASEQVPPAQAAGLERRLVDQPTAASDDLARATSLFQRLVAYVDSAGRADGHS
jgi:DICT domain-containing protein